MTSSLVGSEMCIRDRAEPDLQGARSWIVADSPAWGSASGLQVCPTQGTVSYTHLTLPTICSV
eukprot:7081746-Prorocentrum_lima.AAC.1